MPRKGKITASAVKKQRSTSPRSLENLKPFQPGQSGNPAGREKGSRNKLMEAFLTDFCEAWQKHGAVALDTMAETEPGKFVLAAVAVLPKKVEIEGEQVVYVISDRRLTADEWVKKYGGDAADVEPARGAAKRAN